MSAAYDAVVAALPRLTPAELRRVAERIKMLGAWSAVSASADAADATTTDAEAEAEVLLEVIAGVVLRASGERVSTFALRRSSSFSSFRGKVALLHKFASKHVRSRAARRRLLAVGFEQLYRDLSGAGFSVTARMLMSCAHQLPAIFDKYFPGYAASGLLGMVVGVSSFNFIEEE